MDLANILFLILGRQSKFYYEFIFIYWFNIQYDILSDVIMIKLLNLSCLKL